MPAYSETPLAKKLGIRENFRIRLINIPDYYSDLFTDWPPNVNIIRNHRIRKNLIHFFIRKADELYAALPDLKSEIEEDGMIWVSWPKKASKIQSDLTENIIRNFALEIGLVDIKVCSIDDIWSGLKLVIPVKSRG